MSNDGKASASCLSSLPDLARVNPDGLVGVTQDTYRWLRHATSSLIKHVGDVPPADVTPQDVASWVRSLMDRELSPVTVNSYLRGVRTLFSRLKKNGIVARNPARNVPFVPEPRPSPKAISAANYRAMRAAADNVRDRAIVDVLWASGCRLGGLRSMRVDSIEDLGKSRYALYVIEKFGAPRYVYVGRPGEEQCGKSLGKWLRERPLTHDPHVFVSFDEPYESLSRPGVHHILRRLRERAGIPRGTPASAHAFRHAFAIRMLDQGVDLATVSAWMGHHSPEFTAAVYAVRSEQQLRAKYFDLE